MGGNHESERSIGTGDVDGWVPVGQVHIPRIFKPFLERLVREVKGKKCLPGHIAEMLIDVRSKIESRQEAEALSNTHPTNPGGKPHWCNPKKSGNPRGPGRHSNKDGR